MNTKFCSNCQTEKKISEFYKDKSMCKTCFIEKVSDYQRRNTEKYKEIKARWDKKNSDLKHSRDKVWKQNNKKDYAEYQKNWRNNNKEKIKKYNLKKRDKRHEITIEEYSLLYDYCDGRCMYCGLSEDDSVKIYGQKLHRDHAINNGSNTLDNCILACKRCNSDKNTKDWNVWYNPNNSVYLEERYNSIKFWLEQFS